MWNKECAVLKYFKKYAITLFVPQYGSLSLSYYHKQGWKYKTIQVFRVAIKEAGSIHRPCEMFYKKKNSYKGMINITVHTTDEGRD